MSLDFSASIARNILRVKQEINAKAYKISIDLFLAIVRKSPSPDNPGEHAQGLLANQWYPKNGSSFSAELTSAISRNGAGSNSRIRALKGEEFFGKNGTVTLANNLHYAYRAEVLGWPVKDGWSGKVGPYRMVALALQEVAAKNR